jgi:DNA-binding response OmpR family regulator
MHILLVEDEPHVRAALARPLTAWGHTVTEAASANDAAAALAAGPPEGGCEIDIALVDVNLTDGTGWDVLDRIRTHGSGLTRTIVMSAVPPSGERLRQFRPSGILLKPFPIDSLRQIIARVQQSPIVGEAVIHA